MDRREKVSSFEAGGNSKTICGNFLFSRQRAVKEGAQGSEGNSQNVSTRAKGHCYMPCAISLLFFMYSQTQFEV